MKTKFHKTDKKTSLHEQIAETLRSDFLKGIQPGMKLESEAHLAQRLRVSVNTLRQALSILAHEGLIERRHGSGTYVKDRADERSVAVVLGVDFTATDVSRYWGQLAQRVRSLLAVRGVRNRIYTGVSHPGSPTYHPICPEFIEDVERNRLKGVIVTTCGADHDWMNSLKQQNVPVVGGLPAQFENCVMFDLAAQVRLATQRLLAEGRRKLALMGWHYSGTDSLLKAFAETLAEHGVAVNADWVRREFQPNMPGAGWEEFREIWTGSAEKPDGLVVTDDVLFRGVARAIDEFGIRVPEQLQVVTQSNRRAMEDYPFPVWRMVIDPDAAAEAQVNLLLALLRGDAVAQHHIYIPGQFVAPAPVSSKPALRTSEAAPAR